MTTSCAGMFFSVVGHYKGSIMYGYYGAFRSLHNEECFTGTHEEASVNNIKISSLVDKISVYANMSIAFEPITSNKEEVACSLRAGTQWYLLQYGKDVIQKTRQNYPAVDLYNDFNNKPCK